MKQKRFSNYPALSLIVALCFFHVTVAAAEQETTPPPRTVIKDLAYIEAEALEDILAILPVTYVIKPDLNTIVLRAQSGAMETALAVIENLDVPATLNPSIEMRGYILAVSKDDESVDIPPHLKRVTQELKGIFGYTSYRLVDTVFLRTTNGSGAAVGGSASLPEQVVEVSYALGFNHAQITNFDRSRTDKNNKNIIRLNGLALRRTHQPTNVEIHDHPSISTDIEILEGQTAVIGKARLHDSLGDLILVVEAKVIDGHAG